MTLADQIVSEAGALAFDYPKGASLADIAGYFGAPLPQVEVAIRDLKERGVDLPFLLDGDRQPHHIAKRRGEPNAGGWETRRENENARREDGIGEFAPREKNPDAVALGRRGGEKGGNARAAALSDERRSEIARLAAQARWGEKEATDQGVILTGRDGGPLSDILQEAMESMGSPVDALGHGRLMPIIQKNGIMRERTMTEILVERLRPMLPEFAKQFPFGMTARDLKNHTNASTNVVYEAIQKLVFEGLGIWESEMDGRSNTHRFYVRGMRQLPPALTHNQEAVYEGCLKQVPQNQRGIINCSIIDKENDLPTGSTVTVLYTLERKGLIRRITPWHRTGKKTPAEYEVLALEPREIDWPPPVQPIMTHEPDAEYRDSRTSDGRRLGKQMRRAKADMTRPQDDLVQALIHRQQFLKEELRSLDALIAHYKVMFKIE